MEFDEELLVANKDLSLIGGAIAAPGWQSIKDKGSYTRCIMEALAQEYKFDLNTPYKDLPDHIKDMFIHGTDGKSVKVHYRSQREREYMMLPLRTA